MGEPLRTCVGCREITAQSLLSRYVLVDGRAVLDESKSAPGRGAWVHPREDCLERAMKRGFSRSFRAGVRP